MTVLDGNLRYLSAFPVVVVPELEAATDWYGAAFGFARLTSGSDGGSDWVHLRRGEGQDLVLRAARHPWLLRGQMLAVRPLSMAGLSPRATSTHFAVDTPLSEATEAARRAGAKLVRGRRDETTAALRDPFGYEWALFSRATASKPAPAVKRRRLHLIGLASFRARWRIRLGG